MKTKDEAIEDLKALIPHLREAMRLARLEGEPQLGILAVRPNGRGKVVVQLRLEEFVPDLCRALDLPLENSREEVSEAAAVRLVQMVERVGGAIRSDKFPTGSDE